MNIECFDYENDDEYMLLMNFIHSVADGRRVFVDSWGANLIESFAEKAILASATNLYNTHHYSLFLSELSAKTVMRGIFCSKYTSIYICRDNISWENFLNTHPKNERRLFQKDMFIASIVVGEMESVSIFIKNEYAEIVKQFLQNMNHAGYKLKRVYSIV
jgi:hypothetical protein